MRARGWWVAALLVLSTTSAWSGEPKPKPVDIKDIRDKLIILTDPDGGLYAAAPGSGGKLFYSAGAKKPFYEQVVITRSSDGSKGTWSMGAWAPRIAHVRPGIVQKNDDGTFGKYCGHETPEVVLTEVTADKAKAIIDKASFFTTAITRRPHLLARDDAAVYYYVDVIRNDYGGSGYRVFIGKKGAMKQKPLTDITTDTAGDIFQTKTGDLRIVRDADESGKSTVTWVKGEKRTSLRVLDVDGNSPLIFKDLGVYGFMGSICEQI